MQLPWLTYWACCHWASIYLHQLSVQSFPKVYACVYAAYWLILLGLFSDTCFRVVGSMVTFCGNGQIRTNHLVGKIAQFILLIFRFLSGACKECRI